MLFVILLYYSIIIIIHRFDSIMALRVPEDLKRKTNSASSDETPSSGTSITSARGTPSTATPAGGKGDSFVAAVDVSETHVLWRAWAGPDEEFFASRLEDNGRARSAVISERPEWRSGRAKRASAAAAYVGGKVVYCR